jgi:gamma-glutamylcyclotransferase (GGCT)/AIG2-like uncharacterized protein YtfP
VFSYGSLVGAARRPARLHGHRRVWGVAMDNRVAVPGYKIYEGADGARPAAHVAFLDLERADGLTVNGALLEADAARLAELDERERQYRRVDVTAAVDPAPGGRVWAYVGAPEGRARVAAGRRGRAAVVIQRAYLEIVERAFAALGALEHARFRASTEHPPFRVLELARVDLPR